MCLSDWIKDEDWNFDRMHAFSACIHHKIKCTMLNNLREMLSTERTLKEKHTTAIGNRKSEFKVKLNHVAMNYI